MASAAQQRLRRAQFTDQMALDLEIPAALDLRDDDALELEQGDFASIAADLERAQARGADPWEGSPYAWFRQLPPGRRATVGQVLVSRWLTHCGVNHAPRHGAGDHDLSIEGATGSHTVQLRVSTLWAEGDFVFQGLRAGEFELFMLLAVAPQRAHLWVVPQTEALTHVEPSGWVTVPQGRAPGWLAEHGGSLTAGTRALLA